MVWYFADTLQLVRDKTYGTEADDGSGNWDGMVGELTREVRYSLTFF